MSETTTETYWAGVLHGAGLDCNPLVPVDGSIHPGDPERHMRLHVEDARKLIAATPSPLPSPADSAPHGLREALAGWVNSYECGLISSPHQELYEQSRRALSESSASEPLDPAPRDDSPIRAMYTRLAADYEKRPTVPDLGGGVEGDRYE